MIAFDIVTTATLRPEIHKITYESFCDNLIGVDWGKCRHFVNIDPVPIDTQEKEECAKECVSVSQNFFGQTISNFPSVANFTAAFNWLFSKANSDFILCLEDDWEMTLPMHVEPMVELFSRNKKLTQIVLRAYPCLKSKGNYPANCLSPSFMARHFYKALAGKLDVSKDPEWNIHHKGKRFGLDFPYKKNGLDSVEYIKVFPEQTYLLAVKDIGRQWARLRGLKKPENRKDFTTWVK